jgi:uncharacterized Fe-S cluster protein YjdI
VTVFYDTGRCLHFAECVRGLPEAFDARKRPWIQPENASAEDVAEVVRRCPSGALHYTLEEGPPEEPEQPTRVGFVANGPINLRGDLSIDVPAGRMREVCIALPLRAHGKRTFLRQSVQSHRLEESSAEPHQRLGADSSAMADTVANSMARTEPEKLPVETGKG